MDGDERGVSRLDVTLPSRVGIGLGRGLPAPGVADRQAPLHEIAQPGTFKQGLGDPSRAVAEGHNPNAGLDERAQTGRHVGVQVELGHGADHMLGRLLRRPAEIVDVAQHRGEREAPDGRKIRKAPRRGEGEAVAKRRCEPRRQQVRRRPDLRQPRDQPAEIRQRLVDVENGDARSGLRDR